MKKDYKLYNIYNSLNLIDFDFINEFAQNRQKNPSRKYRIIPIYKLLKVIALLTFITTFDLK